MPSMPSNPAVAEALFILGGLFLTVLLIIVGWLGKRFMGEFIATQDRHGKDLRDVFDRIAQTQEQHGRELRDVMDKLTEQINTKVSYLSCDRRRDECYRDCPGRIHEIPRNSG